MRIAVVNYSVGNIGSVVNALARIGADASLVDDPSRLERFDAVILPGVGKYDTAAKVLLRFEEELERLRGSIPIMGICLGMHLMFESSEEGQGRGLGWYRGRARRLRSGKIPHIGWDYVEFVRNCPLTEELGAGNYFYFMHSYAVTDLKGDIVVGLTEYGSARFVSVFSDERTMTFATQFHPEKSSKTGLILLRNFARLAGEAR